MNFAPLHNHTEYSALDGLSTAKEIMERCQCIGCQSVGITDHGTVSGHLEFAKQASAYGIKPIFGCELYHGIYASKEERQAAGHKGRDAAHLVGLASSDQGLRNLWSLVSEASKNFYFVGRVHWDLLDKYKEGMILTSACIQGLVAQDILKERNLDSLNKYLDIFKDDFYMEIHTYPGEEHQRLNIEQVAIAKERGLPLVYATDAHFACNPAEAPIWMSDMSFKDLGDIVIGDKVVGWDRTVGKKSSLCESEVLAIHEYKGADIVKVVFESGRTLRCTPNHLWKTMSYGGPAGSEYFCEPEIGRTLVHVVDPTPEIPESLKEQAAWLGGMYDGEGEGCGANGTRKVGVSQSDKNPAVVERLCRAFDELGFDRWRELEKRSGYDMNRFFVKGGRSEFVRFANWTNPAQRHKIAASCLSTSWKTPDKIVSVEPDGKETVYGLTTTTANYVAWGYASKNSPEQYEAHDAYVAMQTGETVFMDPEDRKMWHPKSLYIQDESQIRASLDYLPDSVVDEALSNTAEIAERCNVTLPRIERHLPVFIPDESPYVKEKGMDAGTLFLDLVEQGLIGRYGEDAPQEVWERAQTELEVFLEAGLQHYFLQAWDFVQFCLEKEIERGPGRGSAGGAIVSYALGITDIDPLKYDLVFERFYNPGREKGFPDIDNDFPTLDRPRIKSYMEKRWGKDKVCQIGTITRLKPLSAIGRTHKAFGISYAEMEALKKIVHEVPDINILGADSVGWSSKSDPNKTVYVMDHVGEQVANWIARSEDPEMAQRMVDFVDIVCSRVSGYGIHPSGVVVSDVSLQDELPTMWNAHQKTLATMFPMTEVDARGFVKQDFLGLANLDILAEWRRLVQPTLGHVDWTEAEKDYPEEMWETIFDKGLTLGCFQIEDGYARKLCKDFKPRSIEDLGIIVALNRPGPIRSGAPDSFIARRNGEEDVSYDHPILEDILEPTYGWFLYQEQVIRFFSKLGYDLGDADAVRKILGKKKPEDMQALYDGKGEWQGKGYQMMAEQAGIDEESRAVIWSRIEDFAKYSFNKSHAIAYATLCFRTGYAKYVSTPHFVIACIRVATKQQKSKDRIGRYVSEARRMGINVCLPHIHKSQIEIDYVDNEIYYGFTDIKGIGKGPAEFICKIRDEYKIESPEDLFAAIESEQKKWEVRKKELADEGVAIKERSPKSTIPQNRIPPLEEIGAFDDYIDRVVSLSQRQDFEKELLGLILSDESEEILSDNYDIIEDLDDYSVLDEEEHAVVPGVVAAIDIKKTRKSNKKMGIVTIEYQGQQLEFVVFPNDWKLYNFLWKERSVAIFSLKAGDRGIRFLDGQRLTKDKA